MLESPKFKVGDKVIVKDERGDFLGTVTRFQEHNEYYYIVHLPTFPFDSHNDKKEYGAKEKQLRPLTPLEELL